jgi:hypothetical protein
LVEDSMDSVIAEDLKIIKKDVLDGRTDPETFDQETLKDFVSCLCRKLRRNAEPDFGKLGVVRSTSPVSPSRSTVVEEDYGNMTISRYRQMLKNILTAYCRRNIRTGYSQGMNLIASVLLCFMEEENVFWTLCAIVEEIRLSDFYSRPPAMMNGFHVDTEVCYKLAVSIFEPKFPKGIFSSSENSSKFRNTVQLLCTKWLISLFVDSVPLDTLIYVFHKFFIIEGDVSSVVFVLTLISLGLESFSNRTIDGPSYEDFLMQLYPEILSKSRNVSIESFQRSFTAIRMMVSDSEVWKLRDECRSSISKQWSAEPQFLKRLARNTACNLII